MSNSLAEVHPELVSEWSEKNLPLTPDDITFGSNKKVGTIVVGGSPVDSIQYELIDKQFDCMAKYLSWDMLFKKSYYATARDELEKNKDSMNELEGIGKNL